MVKTRTTLRWTATDNITFLQRHELWLQLERLNLLFPRGVVSYDIDMEGTLMGDQVPVTSLQVRCRQDRLDVGIESDSEFRKLLESATSFEYYLAIYVAAMSWF